MIDFYATAGLFVLLYFSYKASHDSQLFTFFFHNPANQTFGSFKQHMFQVMSKARIIGRIIFTARFYGKERHDAWLEVIFCKNNR